MAVALLGLVVLGLAINSLLLLRTRQELPATPSQPGRTEASLSPTTTPPPPVVQPTSNKEPSSTPEAVEGKPAPAVKRPAPPGKKSAGPGLAAKSPTATPAPTSPPINPVDIVHDTEAQVRLRKQVSRGTIKIEYMNRGVIIVASAELSSAIQTPTGDWLVTVPDVFSGTGVLSPPTYREISLNTQYKVISLTALDEPPSPDWVESIKIIAQGTAILDKRPSVADWESSGEGWRLLNWSLKID